MDISRTTVACECDSGLVSHTTIPAEVVVEVEVLQEEAAASPASAEVLSTVSAVSLATSAVSETASKLTLPLLLESEQA